MSIDLLFTRAATGSADLLFGASDAPPDVAPMPVRLALDTGSIRTELRVVRATPATLTVLDVAGSPVAAMRAQWDSNTYRVRSLGVKAPWQLSERPNPATAAAGTGTHRLSLAMRGVGDNSSR